MTELSAEQLEILENEVWTLIAESPETYELHVREAAMQVLQSNIDLLDPHLVNELPAISLAIQLQSGADEVSAIAERLWQMIDGIYMKINEPKVAAVRAAICAVPYPDPQDPQMALEYLIIFSKAAGFSNESIIKSIASAFSITTSV